MGRRIPERLNFALLTIFALLWLCGFSANLSLAYGQSEALIEAARKEGKLTIFGSIQQDVIRSIQASFEKKYPGIQTSYWRASTTTIMDRAMNEFRTGKVTWDVFFTGDDAMEIMRKEGMFAKYQTPAGKHIDQQFHHPFFSPNYRSSIIGFVYNTTYIKAEDAPKSYLDFVDSKWRDKVVMSDPSSHTSMAKWLASLHLVLGDQGREEEYVQRLAANRPLFQTSLTPVAQILAAGEKALGITYIKYVCDLGKTGAPLDYVRLPAYLGESNFIAVGSKALRPNAGRLWIDHWYSKEAMETLAKDCEFVNLPGVYPPLQNAEKVKFVEEIRRSEADYKQLLEKYGKIFKR